MEFGAIICRPKIPLCKICNLKKYCKSFKRENYLLPKKSFSIKEKKYNIYCYLNKYKKKNLTIIDFYPSGSDERQYCSPGYNLPMGVIMRGVPGEYKQYHTSLDNKNIISIKILDEMINIYFEICKFLEDNKDIKLPLS